MSSFKQKLKTLLKDSSVFKIPLNNEQKFWQIMIKIHRKIKQDNNRQSLLSNYNTYFSTNINKHLKEKINYTKKQKGISPKTAANILSGLGLLKRKDSRNLNKYPIYEKMNKYICDNYKIKQKQQNDINYLIDNNTNSYKRKCNRPKSSFNKNKKENKPIFNLKQIYYRNVNDLMKNNNDKEHSKKKNFFDSFNKFRKNSNNKYFKYSRNNSIQHFSKSNFSNY